MTRHGRNATAGAVFTYHERQKASKASGWGSQKLRLGKDSVKNFDCCSLTLQPCKYPVVTPDGHLYDKEAIFEYILAQKRENSRRLKEFERQMDRDKAQEIVQARVEHEAQLEKFRSGAQTVTTSDVSDSSLTATSSTISNVAPNKEKKLPSFWIPSLTPEAEQGRIKKPDGKVRCPMSGRLLLKKDLVDVHFTSVPNKNGSYVQYMCAVTGDLLGNSVPAAVLRTSGAVVTVECVEKLIKKDMLDPTNGKSLTDRDIIYLQRGASGFSSAGVQLEAKKAGPAMNCY